MPNWWRHLVFACYGLTADTPPSRRRHGRQVDQDATRATVASTSLTYPAGIRAIKPYLHALDHLNPHMGYGVARRAGHTTHLDDRQTTSSRARPPSTSNVCSQATAMNDKIPNCRHRCPAERVVRRTDSNDVKCLSARAFKPLPREIYTTALPSPPFITHHRPDCALPNSSDGVHCRTMIAFAHQPQKPSGGISLVFRRWPLSTTFGQPPFLSKTTPQLHHPWLISLTRRRSLLQFHGHETSSICHGTG